jgi:integrase/recombinase XerC
VGAENLQLLVDTFLKGRNQRTAQAYEGDLRQFSEFLGGRDSVEAARVLLAGPEMARAHAQRFRVALVDQGFAPATVNRRLATLRSLVRRAKAMGLVQWTLKVDNVSAEPPPDTKAGQAVFNLLMILLEGRGDPKSLRDRAVVRLLYDLALRREEVIALDLDDVDLGQGTLAIRAIPATGEQPAPNVMPLATPTLLALEAWIGARGWEPGPLFVNFDRAGKGHRLTSRSLYRVITSLGKELGLRLTPNGLRARAPPPGARWRMAE